jgi:hypothetical protein
MEASEVITLSSTVVVDEFPGKDSLCNCRLQRCEKLLFHALTGFSTDDDLARDIL